MRTVRRASILQAALIAAALLAPGTLPAQVSDYHKIHYPPLPEWKIPEAQRKVLDNGIVLFLMEDHELPLVEAFATVKVGGRLDPPDKVGLARILGDVLRTGGAGDRSGDELDEFLESRGAVVESSVDVDSGSVTLSCLKEDFGDVLGVFRDVLMRPRFDQEKIDLAKIQLRTEISRRNDDPNDIVRREFRNLVYGADSPYARYPEYATVDAVSRDDLVAIHQRYFKPNAVIIGVVGDFKSKDMVREIRSAFGAWKKGEVSVPDRFPYREEPRTGVFLVEKGDVTQSSVRIGHLGIRMDNPDYYAAEVMNEVFGRGFSSRLVQVVRSQKGLAYSVGAQLGASYDRPGLFVMGLQTKSETTVEAIEALYEQLSGILSVPPTPAELEHAKNSLLNSFVFKFADRGQILRRTMTYEYYGYPLDFMARYRSSMQRVTSDDVRRVAKEYLHPDKTIVVVVGKSADFDRDLSALGRGEVTALDVSIPEPAMEAPEATAESLEAGRRVLDRIAADLERSGALDRVNGLRTKGSVTLQTPRGEIRMETRVWISFPDRMRQEMTTPMGNVVLAYDRGEGYVENPMGRQPMPESMGKEIREDMLRQPVVLARLLRQGSVRAQYLGTDSLDGMQADVVLVSVDGSEPFKLYVDPKGGRILASVYRGSGTGGSPAEKKEIYQDYRVVEGLPYPFKETLYQDGKVAGTKVTEEVVVNPEMGDELFAEGGSGS